MCNSIAVCSCDMVFTWHSRRCVAAPLNILASSIVLEAATPASPSEVSCPSQKYIFQVSSSLYSLEIKDIVKRFLIVKIVRIHTFSFVSVRKYKNHFYKACQNPFLLVSLVLNSQCAIPQFPLFFLCR